MALFPDDEIQFLLFLNGFAAEAKVDPENLWSRDFLSVKYFIIILRDFHVL